MSKRIFVNALASTLGTLAGLGAMYASVKVMNMPQTKLFWAVLILSGLTVAVFVFFLVWGHFQEITIQGYKCPLCGGPMKARTGLASVKGFAMTTMANVRTADNYECEKCKYSSADPRQPTDPQRQV